MQIPNEKKFFFFYDDSSSIKIAPNTIEHAYLAILNDELDVAVQIFSKIDSPRALWGKILVDILKGYLPEFPTYFQIRNFFEIDLDMLLKNEKISYVEQVLGSLDILSTINQEIFKYTARVMYVNRLYSAALKYMNKSKKIYYNDAELHFMLAKYYLHVNDYEQALFYTEECLKLIPDYYPADLMKQQIDEILV